MVGSTSIVHLFEPTVMPPLSAAELEDFRDEMFTSKPGIATSIVEQHLQSYDDLEAFRRRIDATLTRFKFAEHSLDEWKRRYIFPKPRHIRTQLLTMGIPADKIHFAEEQVINRSESSIAKWVDRNLLAHRDDHNLFFVQGTVGCGKSSLNKYITTVHFDAFKAAKIIPARIECRKLMRFLEEHLGDAPLTVPPVQKLMIRYLKQAIVRDMIHYGHTAFSDGSLAPAIYADDFPPIESGLINFIKEQGGSDNESAMDPAKIAQQLLRAFKQVGAASITKRSSVWSVHAKDLDDARLDIAIAYFLSEGFRFCLLFDGFDYVDAVEFVDNKTLKSIVIDALANWLTLGECRIDLSCGDGAVTPKVSLTVRRNTMAVIKLRHASLYGLRRGRDAYVVGPALPDIGRVLATSMAELSPLALRRKTTNEVKKLVVRITRALRRELDMPLREGGMDPFHGNVRFQIGYMRDVIVDLVADAITRNTSIDQSHALIAAVALDVFNSLSFRGYRLVELLLHSSGPRFENFVNVRRPVDEARSGGPASRPLHAIVDNNELSGYIGNVFNYHSPYERAEDLAFLIEKVRILELIRRRATEEEDAYGLGQASESWLRGEFSRNGWPTSRDFRLSLFLLVREGMLDVEAAADEELFSLLPLGRIATDRLIASMAYVECVYFGTRLPRWARKHSIDLVRSASNLQRWVRASVIHVWLFLRAIRHAESIGAQPGTAFIFERMRSGIVDAISRMELAERGYPTPPVAQARQWISDYVERLAV